MSDPLSTLLDMLLRMSTLLLKTLREEPADAEATPGSSTTGAALPRATSNCAIAAQVADDTCRLRTYRV